MWSGNEAMRISGAELETKWISAARPGCSTIVMLHEGLGSVAHWKDFPEELGRRTGMGVFAYSRQGCGESERLTEKRKVSFMHDEAKHVLPALLKEAEIERPVLLGHSDGGSIALIYAGMFPAATSALILEAPHVFVEDLSVQSIAKAKQLYETTDLRSKLARYHRDVDGAFYGWNDIWLSPEFRAWNIEECLATITRPVLVLQGENDEYGTAKQVEVIQRAVPQAEAVILPACGHWPHRDQREATLQRMDDFLKRLEKREVLRKPN